MKHEKLPCSVDMNGQFVTAKTLVYVNPKDAVVGNKIKTISYCCFSGLPRDPMTDCEIIEVFKDQKEVDKKIEVLRAKGKNFDHLSWIRITEQYKEEK